MLMSHTDEQYMSQEIGIQNTLGIPKLPQNYTGFSVTACINDKITVIYKKLVEYHVTISFHLINHGKITEKS